jgi:hypothetical protein
MNPFELSEPEPSIVFEDDTISIPFTNSSSNTLMQSINRLKETMDEATIVNDTMKTAETTTDHNMKTTETETETDTANANVNDAAGKAVTMDDLTKAPTETETETTKTETDATKTVSAMNDPTQSINQLKTEIKETVNESNETSNLMNSINQLHATINEQLTHDITMHDGSTVVTSDQKDEKENQNKKETETENKKEKETETEKDAKTETEKDDNETILAADNKPKYFRFCRLYDCDITSRMCGMIFSCLTVVAMVGVIKSTPIFSFFIPLLAWQYWLSIEAKTMYRHTTIFYCLANLFQLLVCQLSIILIWFKAVDNETEADIRLFFYGKHKVIYNLSDNEFFAGVAYVSGVLMLCINTLSGLLDSIIAICIKNRWIINMTLQDRLIDEKPKLNEDLIVVFTGHSGHGKDTCAAYLELKYYFNVTSFAKPLKHAVQALFQFSYKQMYDTVKKNTICSRWGISPREALNFVGTELVRNQMHKLIPSVKDNFWILSLVKRYEALRSSNHTNFNLGTRLAVTDGRFTNEITALKNIGLKDSALKNTALKNHACNSNRAIVVKVVRPESKNHSSTNQNEKLKNHASVTAIDQIPADLIDCTIVNDGTLQELYLTLEKQLIPLLENRLESLRNVNEVNELKEE